LLVPPRDTVNRYGPALAPVVAPADQVVDVPPTARSAVLAANPVTDSLKVTEQLRLVAFVSAKLGLQLKAVTVGAAESIVYVSCEDALVEAFPTLSWTAPEAIWSVSVPSEPGAPRDTTNE
jgi:hypothetical protein